MNTQKGFSKILTIVIVLILLLIGVETAKALIHSYNEGDANRRRAESYREYAKNDTSSKYNKPSITVVSPNGGETYTKGTSIDIKWNATNIGTKTLEIDLYKSDGSLESNLSSQVSSSLGVGMNAPYSWHIPTDTSPGGQRIKPGQYKVKVCVSDESGICDISDKYFTVN
jgi:hypothetical protein